MSGELHLSVPPELVDAIAAAVAERLAGQLPANTSAPAIEGNGQLAVRKEKAAELLAMSPDTFERTVLPDLRTVRPRNAKGEGRLRLIPVAELEKWLARNAARTLQEELEERR